MRRAPLDFNTKIPWMLNETCPVDIRACWPLFFKEDTCTLAQQLEQQVKNQVIF